MFVRYIYPCAYKGKKKLWDRSMFPSQMMRGLQRQFLALITTMSLCNQLQEHICNCRKNVSLRFKVLKKIRLKAYCKFIQSSPQSFLQFFSLPPTPSYESPPAKWTLRDSCLNFVVVVFKPTVLNISEPLEDIYSKTLSHLFSSLSYLTEIPRNTGLHGGHWDRHSFLTTSTPVQSLQSLNTSTGKPIPERGKQAIQQHSLLTNKEIWSAPVISLG